MAGTEQALRTRSKQDQALKPVDPWRIVVFKISNRQGYAAICMGNLCEGKSPEEAFARLLHPLRRMGYSLPDGMPDLKVDV